MYNFMLLNQIKCRIFQKITFFLKEVLARGITLLKSYEYFQKCKYLRKQCFSTQLCCLTFFIWFVYLLIPLQLKRRRLRLLQQYFRCLLKPIDSIIYTLGYVQRRSIKKCPFQRDGHLVQCALNGHWLRIWSMHVLILHVPHVLFC